MYVHIQCREFFPLWLNIGSRRLAVTYSDCLGEMQAFLLKNHAGPCVLVYWWMRGTREEREVVSRK